MYEIAAATFAHLSQNWWNDPATYHCAVFLALSGSLAAAAGIGGGGIIVAVLMFMGDMAPHDAVPMSKAVVFAGAIVSSGMNMRKRGPDGRPLIDFDIVAAVVPLALAGTLVGVWLNSRVSPEVIIFILLGTFAVMITSTANKLSEQCAEQAKEDVTSPVLAQVRELPLRVNRSPFGEGFRAEDAAEALVSQNAKAAANAKAERKNMTLVWTLAALLASVILGGVLHKHMLDCHIGIAAGRLATCESVLLNILFGNPHHFLGGANGMGLAAFPLVASGMLCLICFILMWLGFSSRSVAGMAKFDNSFKYSVMAFCTGMLAGLVGIGGGLIFSPFMVYYGVNPHVAVATSTFCVIFTSTSTTLQYSLMGRIFFPLAVVYGVCNQLSSYVGTRFIHALQDRYPYNKTYPTAIVLIAIVVSALLTVAKLYAMASERSSTPYTWHVAHPS